MWVRLRFRVIHGVIFGLRVNTKLMTIEKQKLSLGPNFTTSDEMLEGA